MENILDDPYMGNVVDEMDSDEDQSDLNGELLYTHDKKNLLFGLSEKLSQYDLDFYLKSIPDEDSSYWVAVCLEVIRVYSLNSLRNVIPPYFVGSTDFSKNVKRLIIFLKYQIFDLIDKKIIKKEMNYEELLTALDQSVGNKKLPHLFVYSLHFIDKESMEKFMSFVFKQYETDYVDY